MPGPAHILEEKCKKNEQKHLAMPVHSFPNVLGAVAHFICCENISAVNQKRDLVKYDQDYPTKYLARTNKTDNERKCEAWFAVQWMKSCSASLIIVDV